MTRLEDDRHVFHAKIDEQKEGYGSNILLPCPFYAYFNSRIASFSLRYKKLNVGLGSNGTCLEIINEPLSAYST